MTTQPYNNVVTIMINPDGDANICGRKFDNTVERSVTLQFVEALNETLKLQYNKIRVLLTRFAGETLEPLQNANFANRLSADLYLSIHFYQEKDSRPKLTLYHFGYNDFGSKTHGLSFYRFDQAHLQSLKTTQNWCLSMHSILNAEKYQPQFDCLGCFQLPFKPLVGIKVPAIALEMGIKMSDDFTNFVEPIAQSLSPIITTLMRNQEPWT